MINHRTLMRMPLDKLLRIGDYWGVYVRFSLEESSHIWKKRLVKALNQRVKPWHMKSEFRKWRRT
jgi:hypothetical protein